MDLDIAKELKRYRTSHGLSQRSLAKFLEVREHTIYMWEKGQIPNKRNRRNIIMKLRLNFNLEI